MQLKESMGADPQIQGTDWNLSIHGFWHLWEVLEPVCNGYRGTTIQHNNLVFTHTYYTYSGETITTISLVNILQFISFHWVFFQ